MADHELTRFWLEIPLDEICVMTANRNRSRVPGDGRPGDELDSRTVTKVEEARRQVLWEAVTEPKCANGFHSVAAFGNHG